MGEPSLLSLTGREITEKIRGNLQQARLLLVTMYQSEKWRDMGYESWESYLTSEFQVSSSYLRRQAHAGLLEADIDGNIGTRRESHLRELVESGLEGKDRIRAYTIGNTIAFRMDAQPLAHHYRIAALMIANADKDREGEPVMTEVVDRYINGHIGPKACVAILEENLNTENWFAYTVADRLVCDPKMIPILDRLAKQKSETFMEIYFSETIPSYPEPIPIGDATAATLSAWLNEASAEHRAIARLTKQHLYAERRRIFHVILEEVTANPPSDRAVEALRQLAELEKRWNNQKQ